MDSEPDSALGIKGILKREIPNNLGSSEPSFRCFVLIAKGKIV
jgi:hypothetical protein